MLNDFAQESARKYLKYLRDHRDKGIFISHVRAIQLLMGDELELAVDNIIHYTDELTLRIGADFTCTAGSQDAQVIIISHQKRLLRVQAPEEIIKRMLEAAQQMKVIQFESDMTFLVERVLKWYQKYGNQLCFPTKIPDVPIQLSTTTIPSENQKQAIAGALRQPFTYIWGAPGTGKTSCVLANCILSYLRAGKHVLLLSPTNSALDQCLLGLLATLQHEKDIPIAGNIIRLGISGDVIHTAYSEIVENKAIKLKKQLLLQEIEACKARTSSDQNEDAHLKELERLLALLNDPNSPGGFLNAFPIVAVTVDSCIARIPDTDSFRPDHIFLDEAGYCPVIKALPFTNFHCPFTMLGDHMQLPPVYSGDESLFGTMKWLQYFWGESAIFSEEFLRIEDQAPQLADGPRFERLVKLTLTETFRFGKSLADLLAANVYDANFHSRVEQETVLWKFDTPEYIENTRELRRTSVAEAEAITAFYLSHMNSCSIGILTPYHKQRAKIASLLRRSMKDNRLQDDFEDDVMTIHKSQGREWDVVLLSISETYENRYYTDTSRLKGLQVINTAISRARKLLILVGDMTNWAARPQQLLSSLIAISQTQQPDAPLPEGLIPIQFHETQSSSEQAGADPHQKLQEMIANKAEAMKDCSAPDKVTFGHFPQGGSKEEPLQWIILDAGQDKALLLSKFCLTEMQYADQKRRCFWKKSNLRSWLNGEFYRAAFSDEERTRILKTDVSNQAEECRDEYVALSAPSTEDYIFLLSYREAKQYLPDCGMRKAFATAFARSQAELASGTSRQNTLQGPWWLRSGMDQSARISYVDETGNAEKGRTATAALMVRPAMWIHWPGLEQKSKADHLCLQCGRPCHHVLCTACRQQTDTRALCLRLIKYLNGKEEDAGWNEVQDCTGSDLILREWLDELIQILPSPDREYMAISSLAKRFNRIKADDRKTIVRIYESMGDLSCLSSLKDLERCFLLGIILSALEGEYRFDEAEHVAQLLKAMPLDRLTENTCLAMAFWFGKTERYSLANSYLSILGQNASKDEQLKTETDKLSMRIYKWQQNPYFPSPRQDKQLIINRFKAFLAQLFPDNQ